MQPRSSVSGRHGPSLAAVLTALLVVLSALSARAADAQVAVAANFAAPMQQIAAEFARDTGHRVQVVTGATGNLYAQITNGAPFDVLLAADEKTPARMEAEKLAVPGTRFTYAVGRLVLWSATPGFVDGRGDVLRRGVFQHLAVANPKLAPYGAAAIEVLGALGLAEALRPKIVEGESIAQAAQFVASGSVELGFVALSQVAVPGAAPVGSFWVVPERFHSPIRQQAVLLARAVANPAARALCDYLRGPRAQAVIQAYGYALEDSAARAAADLAPAPSK
jgi:molybdate transport system substrate-binding protein